MKLMIPGPVSTRPEVRAAMAQDIAPWDHAFRPLLVGVRADLLRLAGVDDATHACLPLQGCGHFAIEATIRSLVPPGGKILIPLTGSYGVRMARLARELGRVVIELPIDTTRPIDPVQVAQALATDPGIGHVGLIYSETSAGVIHDPVAVGAVVRAAGRRMILDAVSAFGALPLDLSLAPEIDAAVFTSNKCLEGMPGLSFTLARNDALEALPPAGSWSFDLGDIFRHGRGHGAGSFRFTPPAQVLAAFRVAIDLHAQEGAPARLARYRANADALYDGMLAIGLEPYLPRDRQGPIVLNVQAPDDAAWSLQGFVDGLKQRGYLISNFFDTPAPSFRVGCIGQLMPDDMRGMCAATEAVLRDMGIRQRAPRRQAA